MSKYFHIIQHFIYSDHKAEVVVGTTAAATSGYLSSTKQIDFATELMWRDINTMIISVAAAIVGFFVTMGLKKYYEKKEGKK